MAGLRKSGTTFGFVKHLGQRVQIIYTPGTTILHQIPLLGASPSVLHPACVGAPTLLLPTHNALPASDCYECVLKLSCTPNGPTPMSSSRNIIEMRDRETSHKITINNTAVMLISDSRVP
jgi:hypothetical protein